MSAYATTLMESPKSEVVREALRHRDDAAALRAEVEKLRAELEADKRRIAELEEACKAAVHVWEQGCVDRGFKDERNWIDEAKDLLDDALTPPESP